MLYLKLCFLFSKLSLHTIQLIGFLPSFPNYFSKTICSLLLLHNAGFPVKLRNWIFFNARNEMINFDAQPIQCSLIHALAFSVISGALKTLAFWWPPAQSCIAA